MNRTFTNLAYDLFDLVRSDATRRQPARAVDIGMRHGPARVRLERQCLRHPAFAEISGQRLVVCLRRMSKAVEEAVRALEHGTRTVEAVLRQQHCTQARLRRPAGMQALGPRAL